DPDFATDELTDPHGKRVASGAGAANIDIRPDRHQRIRHHFADAALALRLAEKRGVIGTGMRRRIVHTPDVTILLRPLLLILAPDRVENRRKPRVVTPVEFDKFAVVRRIDP